MYLLILLMVSTGVAGNTGSVNLAKLDLCNNSIVIQVNNSDTESLKLKDDIYRRIETKMTAYRIKRRECKFFTVNRFHVQVDMAKAKNGLIAFSINLNLFNNSLMPGDVSIYSDGAFGIASSKENLSESVLNLISEEMDSFAANYAKANPQ